MRLPPSAEIKMSTHEAKLLSVFMNASKLPPTQKDDAGNWNLRRDISARLSLFRPIWVPKPAE